MTTKRRVAWILGGLLVVVAIAGGALAWTFTETTLELPSVDIGVLPPSSPPGGMSISAVPTGTYETPAGLAFRGGSFDDVRKFSTTALLVRHPRGNLLIDAGMGKNADAHVALLPAMQRDSTHHQKGVPAAVQLATAGVTIAGVIPTHAHWDHVGGIEDLGVPVLVSKGAKAFIDTQREDTAVLHSMRGVTFAPFEFEGGPYLGFPRSHDVWGDGSVVVVPAPGHTPDSVVVFVFLPSGARYALLGDLVWQNDALDRPAEKPWMLRRIIGEDDDEVRRDLARVRVAREKYGVQLIPAHEARAFASIPVLPASSD